jgi:uncharacterized protein (TIGR02001 family)
MRKSILTVSVVAALAAPGLAAAQAPAAPASPHTLTGNVGLFSEYRFRGIDQTFGKPALQGGFDYAHSSGFYAGNWNSSINEGAGFPGGSLEMDFYGGFKKSFGDFGFDVGAIYYFYPGTDASSTIQYTPFNTNSSTAASGTIDNKEVYIGASWKFLSLKYYHALDDYFGMPGSKGTNYIDLGATWDLGNGWGVNGHVGQLKFKGVANADYTDWKLGVTKDVGGYVFGLAYLDTNAKGNCSNGEFYCFGNGTFDAASTNALFSSKTKDAGDSTIVFSVSKSF